MGARSLTPTSMPLSPQDIHPDELRLILAESAVRRVEAAKALEAAQDHFDAADRQRAYALSEEQKRKAREERFRIDRLRELVPFLDNDTQTMELSFRRACAEEVGNAEGRGDVHEWFLRWAQYRSLAHRARQEVMRYDADQSRDDYSSWIRRIAGWNQLIGAATSWRMGGVLRQETNDVEGLAAANERIVEDSKDAPRPLVREADDYSTPLPEDLGITDPVLVGMSMSTLTALEFGHEYSKAVNDAATSWARRSIELEASKARDRFKAEAAEAITAAMVDTDEASTEVTK